MSEPEIPKKKPWENQTKQKQLKIQKVKTWSGHPFLFGGGGSSK
jgi:hypothetical protein